MKISVLELGNLVQGFKLSCQTEGLSPKTTEWYTSFLQRFLRFLEESELTTRLDRIEKTHIRRFILYLQQDAKTPRTNKPLSGATVQGYVRTLKAFFAWAEREEYTPANLMVKIPVPKAETRVITTFTETQIQNLFTLCLSSKGHSIRNMVILLLLLDCGLRVSELVGIELNDIDLEEGVIKIRKAKGNKERYVPVGSIVQRAVWKYINILRPRSFSATVNNLLLNDNGLPLTRNGVQQMLRRYGRKAGIVGVRCSPHTLRHTFARNYLLNGGDIFSLQKILGHSSLASVRMYLNLFTTDIKTQHTRFSPVDNLTQKPVVHLLFK